AFITVQKGLNINNFLKLELQSRKECSRRDHHRLPHLLHGWSAILLGLSRAPSSCRSLRPEGLWTVRVEISPANHSSLPRCLGKVFAQAVPSEGASF
ncbi:unnamed protein product, partial [Ectocarpus sp. 12 AP-2014]